MRAEAAPLRPPGARRRTWSGLGLGLGLVLGLGLGLGLGLARGGVLCEAALPARGGGIPLEVEAGERLLPLGPEQALPVLPSLPGHPAAEWPVGGHVAVAVRAVEGLELLEAGVPRGLQRRYSGDMGELEGRCREI